MKLIQQSMFKLVFALCIGLGMSLTYGGVGQGGSGRISFGEITEFGSIFVNGIEYSTSSANIIINGVAGRPESELRLGMAVRVEGSINSDGKTGVANTVEFSGDIEATIDAAPVITGSRGTFTMYGIVIKTDSKTKYDNVSGLAALAAGNAVEVSGFFNANDGSFSATRIEKQPAFRKVELRGFTSNVTATTFRLGPSLIVNYSAAELKDIPPGGLTNGMYVEVKSTTQPSNNTLQATRVSVESSVLASSNIAFGLVQGLAANVTASSFIMGNQPIVIDSQTVFTGGSVSALANGAKAIAGGPVVNGVMTAEQINIIVPGTPTWSADLSGDRKSDIVFRDANGAMGVALMNGTSATALANILPAGSGWSATQVADFDGDGKADIVIRNTDGRIALLMMNGTIAQSYVPLVPAGSGWTATHAADFNGDGKADLLLKGADGRIAVLITNGTANPTYVELTAPGSLYTPTHTGDFNGDGKRDIVLRHANGSAAILLMNGATVVSSSFLLNAGGPWSVTHVADLDGDGNTDVIIKSTDGSAAILTMSGTTVTGATLLLTAGSPYVVTHTGDFNGDGSADILIKHTDGSVAMLIMNGTRVTSAGLLLTSGATATVAQVADYNGDGKSDIVLRNADGSATVVLMNGTTVTAAGNVWGAGTLQAMQ
jgi:Domain of unknown function (DUF5666)/FG-GAP-like repeat